MAMRSFIAVGLRCNDSLAGGLARREESRENAAGKPAG
jgi:hypothetical protein